MKSCTAGSPIATPNAGGSTTVSDPRPSARAAASSEMTPPTRMPAQVIARLEQPGQLGRLLLEVDVVERRTRRIARAVPDDELAALREGPLRAPRPPAVGDAPVHEDEPHRGIVRTEQTRARIVYPCGLRVSQAAPSLWYARAVRGALSRPPFDPAGAGAVLVGTTAAGIGAGALVGWAAGSVGLGVLGGAFIGVPAAWRPSTSATRTRCDEGRDLSARRGRRRAAGCRSRPAGS